MKWKSPRRFFESLSLRTGKNTNMIGISNEITSKATNYQHLPAILKHLNLHLKRFSNLNRINAAFKTAIYET